MAHFVKVRDGIVVSGMVAEQEFIDNFVDDSPGKWIKTSYNIRGGVYIDPETGKPAEDQSVIDGDEARQRKNYAGIGFTYDEARDAFIPPKPFPSWTLNETTCQWDAPTPIPTDGNPYYWNEETQTWDSPE